MYKHIAAAVVSQTSWQHKNESCVCIEKRRGAARRCNTATIQRILKYNALTSALLDSARCRNNAATNLLSATSDLETQCRGGGRGSAAASITRCIPQCLRAHTCIHISLCVLARSSYLHSYRCPVSAYAHLAHSAISYAHDPDFLMCVINATCRELVFFFIATLLLFMVFCLLYFFMHFFRCCLPLQRSVRLSSYIIYNIIYISA